MFGTFDCQFPRVGCEITSDLCSDLNLKYHKMVYATFLLHFLPLLDLGITFGRHATGGIQIKVKLVQYT